MESSQSLRKTFQILLGHRRRKGQVLRRELSTPGRHDRRELPRDLRAGHLQGHGDLPALGHRAAVRRRLAHRRQTRLLQPHSQRYYCIC